MSDSGWSWDGYSNGNSFGFVKVPGSRTRNLEPPLLYPAQVQDRGCMQPLARRLIR